MVTTVLWMRPPKEVPEDDTIVTVITPGGEERELCYYRNMWFLPDKSMYVYFTPLLWRKEREW